MDGTAIKWSVIGIGAAVAGVVLYKLATKGAKVIGEVAQAADTVVAAPVLAAGDALGIPRTSETACEQAKREGRTWDASFACPALDFLEWVTAGSPSTSSGGTTGDFARMDRQAGTPAPAGQFDPMGNYTGTW